jgi:3-methyladenine DNA glycosylase AlkD
MTATEVLARLRALANPAVTESLARFALPVDRALGVTTPHLRTQAREIGKDHGLALELWATGISEARLLAPMVDDPARVSAAQMERWVRDLDSWGICDDCCFELFDKTRFAWPKALEWSRRRAEFEKRAGFALMAALARHDREAPDRKFTPFFVAIERESGDGRNFVKKAVNWALREIGKRNPSLNRMAVERARAIHATGLPSARWIASDALRELQSPAVQTRFEIKAKRAAKRDGGGTGSGAAGARSRGAKRPALRTPDSRIRSAFPQRG